MYKRQVANGRVATVAIDKMSFLVPVKVGAIVACYTDVINVGTSSIQILVEVWADHESMETRAKVTEGLFVFVAIDEQGRTRAINK